MSRKILFLTLRTFSGTGGIEKVSRVAAKAMFDIASQKGDTAMMISMYDKPSDVDTRYIPSAGFNGLGRKRALFVLESVLTGIKCDVIVLSHINLLKVGYLIKRLSPGSKLVLIAHGIEAWAELPAFKKKMLGKFDHIIAVSGFTKEKLVSMNGIPPDKITVINNCLDPFLRPRPEGGKNEKLLRKYGFEQDDIILLTLGRMAQAEAYKGYDRVFEALDQLRDDHPHLKYLLVGQYDSAEKERIDAIVESFGLEDRVVFTGFIAEDDLAEYFNLADIYIMPSEGEGFGIVFIEAMYYNKPVIAGNKDGSTDALLNGKLGLLVDPSSSEEVASAIESIISDRCKYIPDRQLLMDHFSFGVYREKWKKVLEEVVSS